MKKKTIIVTGFLISALMFLVLTFPENRVSAQKDRRVHIPAVRTEEGPFVSGRVLVKFRSNFGLDHARQTIAAIGARDADELPALGVFVLDLPEQADEAAFAHAMKMRPDVEFAELDRLVPPADTIPNDPWYGAWQWHLAKISSPAAWSVTTGSNSIVIAILDTGVDGSHEDLANKLVAGRNIYNGNSDTADIAGHGTNVAGVAAAISDNLKGVASICWACKIMPIRVTDPNSLASYSNLASGLTWAADHGARVANMSFIASDSATVRSAAQYFQSKGGVVTSSAGNYTTFSSAPDNPYILTVSAMNQSDSLSDFSNYGNNIDLAAPEGGYTTAKGGGYIYAGGTSFAAPIVAGVAALVLSVNPNLSGPQVQDIMKRNSDDFGTAGWDIYYGSGRVNAALAVRAAGGSSVDSTAPVLSIMAPSSGSVVSAITTVQVSATDNAAVSSVTLTLDGNPLVTTTASPYNFQWNTTTVSNGSHVLAARATDTAGNFSSTQVSVFVSNSTPPPDTIAPTVIITAPAAGQRVSGSVSVFVDASDNLGVVRNELYVDGVLTSSSTSVPFTTKWNTRKAKSGAHSLVCKAYDAAGNVSTSPVNTVYK
jgi:thermitase